MKITAVILLATCLQAAAAGYGQKVTISEKDAPVEKIFGLIRKQTGFQFLYANQVLAQARKVTIQVKNAELEDVLAATFQGQPFDYHIKDKTIIVRMRPAPQAAASVAQQPPIDVRGRVVNENGDPVEGVSVSVKGSTITTSTNSNGEFFLKDIEPDAALIFTSVNTETFEYRVGGRKFIDINLQTKVSALQEVVINKGYYTEKRRFSTSNVSKITAKEIEKQPVNNPLLALQGRVPGLQVIQSNGIPGGGLTVRIQGQNSIGYGNDPLIVVDGVPFLARSLNSSLGGSILGSSSAVQSGVQSPPGNPLSFINPLDIESIDVLKDADATAIYGSRAANGAILITTKKGKAGKTKVDINLQQGWGKVANFIEMLNSEQYMEMRREAKFNDNASVLETDYDLNGLWDNTRYTDWQKELIGGTAHFGRYYSSISGGSANMQYLLGGTYQRESTVFPGDFEDTKGSVHFTFNATSENKKFQIQFTGSYMANKSNLPAVDLTRDIFFAPVAPALYNEDGTLNWAQTSTGISSWDNPVAQIYNIFENKATNLVSNAQLKYNILSGLQISANIGYTSTSTTQFTGRLTDAVKPETRPTFVRSASFATNNIKTWIIEPQLSYKKDLKLGKFEVIAGSSIQQQDNDGNALNASGQPNDQLLKNIGSASRVSGIGSEISQYKYNAVFGRVNYNLFDKYIVNLTARRDGSSRFGDNNRFHNFGSVGAAWIFSQEKIFKELPFVNMGKIRASYGTSGSDQIPDYQNLNLYLAIAPGNPYQGIVPLTQVRLPNAYLAWEETRKLQMGIDLGLFQDRLQLTANYIRNRSSNQLLNYNLPYTTGFTSIFTNFPALVQNIAWEFFLSSQNIRSRNFKWMTNINLTIPENKLLEFPGLANSSYSSQLVIGQPLGILQFPRFFGTDPLTGKAMLADKQGNPTTSTNSVTDLTVYISPFPKFYGGIENSIEFKNFHLDFLVQFTKQEHTNYYDNNTIGISPGNFSSGRANQPTMVQGRWQNPGDITPFGRYSTSPLSGFSGHRNLEDLSYIRLKNVALSYQLGEAVLRRIHMRTIRVYVNAQNVVTFTRYNGLDPEGKNLLTLPPLRVITAGLQLGL